MHINLYDLAGDDIVNNLLAENPGVVIQVSDEHKHELKEFFEEVGVGFTKIGYPVPGNRKIVVKKKCGFEHEFDIDALRDTWYKTSYALDQETEHERYGKETLYQL